tara:strand:+ start:516 stop:911 length:396 start_codon:yes stop_codon:yes gene_type:complete
MTNIFKAKLKKDDLPDFIQIRKKEIKEEKIKDKNTKELRSYRSHEIPIKIKQEIADEMGVTIRTAQRLYIRYDISEMPESIESMELKNKFDNTQIKLLCNEQESILYIDDDEKRIEAIGKLQKIRKDLVSF